MAESAIYLETFEKIRYFPNNSIRSNSALPVRLEQFHLNCSVSIVAADLFKQNANSISSRNAELKCKTFCESKIETTLLFVQDCLVLKVASYSVAYLHTSSFLRSVQIEKKMANLKTLQSWTNGGAFQVNSFIGHFQGNYKRKRILIAKNNFNKNII